MSNRQGHPFGEWTLREPPEGEKCTGDAIEFKLAGGTRTTGIPCLLPAVASEYDTTPYQHYCLRHLSDLVAGEIEDVTER